jgi:hypothetical protein
MGLRALWRVNLRQADRRHRVTIFTVRVSPLRAGEAAALPCAGLDFVWLEVGERRHRGASARGKASDILTLSLVTETFAQEKQRTVRHGTSYAAISDCSNGRMDACAHATQSGHIDEKTGGGHHAAVSQRTDGFWVAACLVLSAGLADAAPSIRSPTSGFNTVAINNQGWVVGNDATGAVLWTPNLE